ncbi:YbaB/EbfC family nucleoid-associated protein [Actinokineospora inagensis]|uniref:YbaB/EbfC family nucleoid-associated protein n=1 Tax=Actinokineospora inagensis TaxID=103730 RepID=UPI000410B2FD|nr:YbaB/EbfC family nucleoid-associated protein [Actinokineospora inagensis]
MVGDPNAELSAVESMVADWGNRGQQRLAQVKEFTDRVAGLTATARSSDGKVTVSVDSRGLPTHISVEGDPELTGSIMAALQSAQSRLPQLMTEVAQQAGMAGDSVVGHLLEQAESSFPQPPASDPAPTSPEPHADDDYFDNSGFYRGRN